MKEGGLGDVKFTLVSYLPRYPTDLPAATGEGGAGGGGTGAARAAAARAVTAPCLVSPIQ